MRKVSLNIVRGLIVLTAIMVTKRDNLLVAKNVMKENNYNYPILRRECNNDNNETIAYETSNDETVYDVNINSTVPVVDNEENTTNNNEENNVAKENDTKEEMIENIEPSTNTEEKKNENNQTVTSEDKIIDVQEDISDDKIDIKDDGKLKIVDKSNGMCAQALDYFYEDNYYRYYFTCKKSSNIYVIFKGKEFKLVDALNNGIVTISDLENAGYKFNKESKNVVAY